MPRGIQYGLAHRGDASLFLKDLVADTNGFRQEEVAQMLRIIHDNFDNAYVMMETTSPFWVRKQSIEKSVQDTGAVFTWGVNRFSEMQNLAQGFHSVKDDNILRGMAKLYPAYRLISWLPVVKNMAEKILIFQKD